MQVFGRVVGKVMPTVVVVDEPVRADHFGGFREVEGYRFEMAAEVVNLERTVTITGVVMAAALARSMLAKIIQLSEGCRRDARRASWKSGELGSCPNDARSCPAQLQSKSVDVGQHRPNC